MNLFSFTIKFSASILIFLLVSSCKTKESILTCSYTTALNEFQKAIAQYQGNPDKASCEATRNAAAELQKALRGCEEYSTYAHQINDWIQNPCTEAPKEGKASFWMAEKPGCDVITVTINGRTANITRFSNSENSCNISGTATFALPPGTYAYTASCTGETWSGDVTITSEGCNLVELKPKPVTSGINLLTTENTESITIDKEGNIYTLGTETELKTFTKYNAEGGLIWKRSYDYTIGFYNMTIGMDGSIYGIADCDKLENTFLDNKLQYGKYFVKIDGTGKLIWAKSYKTVLWERPSSYVKNATIDNEGNIYVVVGEGRTLNFIAKYNNAGEILWEKFLPGAWGNPLIQTDDGGNVYINGYFSSSLSVFSPGKSVEDIKITGNYYDVFCARFDKNGNITWLKSTKPNTNDIYFNPRVIVTISGDFYMLTTTLESGFSKALYLQKYNANGQLAWQRKVDDVTNYPGDQGSENNPNIEFNPFNWQITVDHDGDVYLTGGLYVGKGRRETTYGLTNQVISFDGLVLSRKTDAAGFIMKYDAQGNPLWLNSLGDNPKTIVRLNCITTDQTGKIYIGGYIGGFAGAELKFNNSPLTIIADYSAIHFLAKGQY